MMTLRQKRKVSPDLMKIKSRDSSYQAFNEFSPVEINEGELLDFYSSFGLNMPKGLSMSSSSIPAVDIKGSAEPLGIEHRVQVTFTPHQHITAFDISQLDVTDTDKGLLITNLQSYPQGGWKSSPQWRPLITSIDKGLGIRTCIDLLKCVVPDKDLYILAPHEVRNMWGKKSELRLWDSNFWRYVQRWHQSNFTRLLARALWEDPDVDSNRLENFARLSEDEIQAAEEIVEENGFVHGGRLLNRIQEEFLTHRYAKKPLGKRRSSRFYDKIPREHGFKPAGSLEFADQIAFEVLRFNPKDIEAAPKAKDFQKLLQR